MKNLLQFIVIIPAYEPTDAIIVLARQLSLLYQQAWQEKLGSTMPLPVRVIVVDDGSDATKRHLFSEIAQMPGCQVVRH